MARHIRITVDEVEMLLTSIVEEPTTDPIEEEGARYQGDPRIGEVKGDEESRPDLTTLLDHTDQGSTSSREDLGCDCGGDMHLEPITRRRIPEIGGQVEEVLDSDRGLADDEGRQTIGSTIEEEFLDPSTHP